MHAYGFYCFKFIVAIINKHANNIRDIRVVLYVSALFWYTRTALDDLDLRWRTSSASLSGDPLSSLDPHPAPSVWQFGSQEGQIHTRTAWKFAIILYSSCSNIYVCCFAAIWHSRHMRLQQQTGCFNARYFGLQRCSLPLDGGVKQTGDGLYSVLCWKFCIIGGGL